MSLNFPVKIVVITLLQSIKKKYYSILLDSTRFIHFVIVATTVHYCIDTSIQKEIAWLVGWCL